MTKRRASIDFAKHGSMTKKLSKGKVDIDEYRVLILKKPAELCKNLGLKFKNHQYYCKR
jgi:hypothetical protein